MEKRKRILAWLLTATLTAGNMPLPVSASAYTENTSTAQTLEEENEKPSENQGGGNAGKVLTPVNEPDAEPEPEGQQPTGEAQPQPGENQPAGETKPQPEEHNPESKQEAWPEEITETEPENAEEASQETPQLYAETKISVLYSDVNNIAQRRELNAEKLLEVYADGAPMENQPEITLDSTEPEEMWGAQSYTYTIHKLPIYREEGTEKIEYTIIEEDVLNGYVGFTGRALPHADAGQAGELLSQMQAPDSEIKLVQGEEENTLQAEKKFGNYLPAYEVSGTVTWVAEHEQSVRPDMENYFQNQFKLLREETEYSAYKLHYEQDGEAEDSWNFTVEGLFTTKEDGSSVSYVLKAGEVEGYTLKAQEAAVKADNGNLKFAYKAKEQEKPQKVKARKDVTKAAVKAEPLTADVIWTDNNYVNRPNLITTGKVFVEYQKGSEGWKKLTDVSDTELAALGIEKSGSPWITAKTDSKKTTYTAANLPAQTTDGTALTYRIKKDLGTVPEYLYMNEGNQDYLIKTISFTGEIVLRNGEIGPYKPGEQTGLAKLFTVTGTVPDKESDTGTAAVGTQYLAKSSIWVEDYNAEAKSYAFKNELPEFDINGQEITWMLTAVKNPTELNGEPYEPEYDNKNSANHGSEMNACYQNGKAILTRKGLTHFEAYKDWLDTDASKRPTADMTLWRYTKKGDNDFTTATLVSKDANPYQLKITKDNSNSPNEKDYVPENRVPFVIGVENGKDALPKYDQDGYEYIYMVKEVLTGGRASYEKVYGQVKREGDKITVTDTVPYAKRDAYDKFLYDGGTLSNRISGSVTIEQRKVWKAAAVQDLLGAVDVDMTLFYRPVTEKGDAEEWIETDTVQTLSGFRGEEMSKLVSAGRTQYDEFGKELEYRWVETAIRNDGSEVVIDANGNFSMTLSDGETYSFTSGYEEEEDATVNRIVGKTQYTVKKFWQEADGSPLTEEHQKMIPGKIAVTLYRDGVKQTDAELNAQWTDSQDDGKWIYVFKDLDKYDRDGHEYVYAAVEHDIAWWHTSSTYNPKDEVIHDKKDLEKEIELPLNLKLVNTPPGVGNEIAVEKQWLDDSNLESRRPVTARVVAERNICTVSLSAENAIVENSVKLYKAGEAIEGKAEILLTETENWYKEVGVPYAFEWNGTDAIDTVTDTVKNAIKTDGISGAAGKLGNFDAYDVEEIKVDGVEVETRTDQKLSGENLAGTYVTAGDYHYEVRYHKNKDGKTGNFGKPSFIIINRRIGTVNLAVTKTWRDKGAETKERPEMYLEVSTTAPKESVTVEANGTIIVHGKDKTGNPIAVETRQICKGTLNEDNSYNASTGKLENAELISIAAELGSNRQEVVRAAAAEDAGDDGIIAAAGKDGVQTYTFFNLPKYDAEGRVITYAVDEKLKEGQSWGYYSMQKEDGGYNVQSGKAHTVDVQSVNVENGRSGSKDVAFIKVWKDEYNKVNGKRPDIHLNLYQKIGAAPPTPVPGYQDRDWKTVEQTEYDNDYHWTCIFPGLPRYDGDGQEILYYAEEKMSVEKPDEDYDYVIPTEQNKADSFGKDTKVKTVDGHTLFEEVQLKDGENYGTTKSGTIINRIQSSLKMKGRKIWKGIEGVENDIATVDFPTITLVLERKIPVKKPGGGYDYEKDTEFNSLKVGARLVPDEWNKDTQTGRIPGTNEFQFVLESYTDELGNTQTVQKYPPDLAWPYEYYIKEAVADVNGIDVDTAYEVQDNVLNNYAITNVYNSQKGQLQVEKTWSGIEEYIKKYPNSKPEARFVLYSQYETNVTDADKTETGSDGEKYTKKKQVKQMTLTPDKTVAVFEDLPVYAPNLKPYRYWVAEIPVNGFAVDTTADADGKVWEEKKEADIITGGSTSKTLYLYNQPLQPTALNGAAISKIREAAIEKFDLTRDLPTEAAITNAYQQPEIAEVTVSGEKSWEDFNNKFGTRPNDLELTLYRWAERQSGSVDNSIAKDVPEKVAVFNTTSTKLDLATGDSIVNTAGDVLVSWNLGTTSAESDKWTFTISKLDRYAPNGSPWKYKLEETKADPWQKYYHSIPENGAVTEKSVAAGSGNVTLNTLTNSIYHDEIKGEKKWAGISADVEKPEVTVQLQVKRADEAEWSWVKGIPEVSEAYADFAGVTPDIMVKAEQTLNKNNEWKYSYTELPKGKVVDGKYQEYKYRVLETKVGATAVKFDNTTETGYKESQAPLHYLISTEGNNVVNTLEGDYLTTFQVTKKWADENNRYHTRQLDKDGKWTVKFKVYRYTEDTPEIKEPVNDTKGSQMTLTVTGNGDSAKGAVENEKSSTVLKNLPAFDLEGKPYKYCAVELQPNGTETGAKRYHGAYTVDGSGIGSEPDGNACAVTVTNTLDLTNLEVTKSWIGDINADNGEKEAFRPENIKLELSRYEADSTGNEIAGTREVVSASPKIADPVWVKGEAAAWTYTYKSLPKYAASGNAYVYTVKELPDNQKASVDGYFAPVTGDTQIITDNNQTVTVENKALSFLLEKADEASDPITGKETQITLTGADAATKGYTAAWHRSWKNTADKVVTTDYVTVNKGVTETSDGTEIYKAEGQPGTVLIKGLPLGAYKLSEDIVPYGYIQPDSPAKLTLGEDAAGKLKLTVQDGADYVAADTFKESPAVKITNTGTSPISITKTDWRTDKDIRKLLSGAEFLMKPTAGSTFVTAAKNASGIVIKDTEAYKGGTEPNPTQGELVINNSYIIEETAAPDKYIKSDTKVMITLDEKGIIKAIKCTPESESETQEDAIAYLNEEEENNILFRNQPVAMDITLEKTDETDGKPLPGVKVLLEKKEGDNFEPYTPAGHPDGIYQTDKGGILKISGLEKGDYRLTEAETITGYRFEKDTNNKDKKFSATFTVGVPHHGADLKITRENADKKECNLTILEGAELLGDTLVNKRAAGSVTLTKHNHEAQGLNGAVFTLYKKDGDKRKKLGEFKTGKTYTSAEDKTGVAASDAGRLTVAGLEWGDYTLEETTPADGYYIGGEAKADFHIGWIEEQQGQEAAIKRVELNPEEAAPIVNAQTKFTIQKKGSDVTELLKGAEFEILDKNAKAAVVRTVKAAEGTAEITGLPTGNYILRETKAPQAYLLAEDIEFTITAYGKITIKDAQQNDVEQTDNIITVTDKPTSITFKKVGKIHEECSDNSLGEGVPDAETDVLPLAGVEFTLYKAAACTDDDIVAAALSSDDGEVVFNNLDEGDYWIKETTTPDGYLENTEIYQAKVSSKAEDYQGIMDKDGKPLKGNQVVNDVLRTDIKFKKVNEQNQEEVLPGCVYGLYKVPAQKTRSTEAGLQLIAKAVTDKNGMVVFKGVLMNTEYTIRELEAPDGSYVSANPIKITFELGDGNVIKVKDFDNGSGTAVVDADGNITWLEPSVQVSFLKTDEEGRPLAGAKLQVQDKDGKVMEEWISEETPYLSMRKLVIGETYQLVEVEAPQGYRVAEPVEFTVDDTPVGPGEEKVTSVEMKDEAIILNILKTAEDGKEVLEGAEFTLEGKFTDKTSVKEIKPGKEGASLEKLLVAGKTYTLTETKAPQGYEKLDKPIVFTMNTQGIAQLKSKEERIFLENQENGSRLVITNRRQQKEQENEQETPPEGEPGNPPQGGEQDNPPQQNPGALPQGGLGNPSESLPVGKPNNILEELKNKVKTGDNSKPLLYTILAVLSISTAGIFGRKRRKNK